MRLSLTATARSEPWSKPILVCYFCQRPAELEREATIKGEKKSVWLCGHCTKSKQIIKNWEVIS